MALGGPQLGLHIKKLVFGLKKHPISQKFVDSVFYFSHHTDKHLSL